MISNDLGHMSALLNMSDVTQQKASANELEGDLILRRVKPHTTEKSLRNLTAFFIPPLLSYSKTSFTQTAGDISTLTGMAAFFHRVTHFESEVDFQVITRTVMRSLAYRLHKMELLSLFLPPVRGSRSI